MLIRTGANILPENIRLRVAAYDQAELDMLMQLPQWKIIQSRLHLEKNGTRISDGIITVPKQPFLRYAMFPWRDVYSLEQIADLVDVKEALISGLFVTYPNDEIGLSEKVDATSHRPEAEGIGEALGLCVADYLFETSDLDWRRIPEGSSKTLDTVASNSTLKIEWESKGSLVLNASYQSRLSSQKKSIKDKKAAINHTATDDVVRLGSITAIGKDSSVPSIVYLLDPPVSFQERNPVQVRIINRLHNIADLVSTIKPRSQMAASLQTRVAAIDALNDFSQLNLEPIRSGTGEPFDVGRGDDQIHSRFFSSRSVVEDENVGGIIIFLDNGLLFFYGMQGHLVELAAEQQFDAIVEYASVNTSQERTIACVIGAGAVRRATGKQPSDLPRSMRSGEYIIFTSKGVLHYTSGGGVFGWMTRPNELGG